MKKRVFLSLIAITVTLIFNGCKKKDNTSAASSGSATSEVAIQNNMFNPASITVAVNTTVRWTNKDGVAHTVTSNTNLFDSGNIGSNGTYSHQFTTAGTYAYKCTIHSGMTGTVIVQ